MAKKVIIGNYYRGKKVYGGVEIYNRLLYDMFVHEGQDYLFPRDDKNKIQQLINIFKCLWRKDVDSFFLGSPGLDNLLVLFTKKTIIYEVHALELISKKEKINVKQWILEKIVFRYVDIFVFPSERFLNDAIEKYKTIRNKKTIVIPHPIDLKLFAKSKAFEKQRVYLTMGAFKHEKGIRHIENILISLPDSYSYKWVGINEKQLLENRTYISQIESKYSTFETIQHITDNIYKKRLLEQSIILIIPSEYETFCISGIEAAALGIPLILSKNVGIAQIVEKYKAGIVVDFSNIKELSNSFSQILNNYDSFCKNAIDMAQEFSVDLIKKEYLSLFTEIE